MQHLRPHLDLLKALGCNVLVFAETSNAIHGDRGKPLADRPVLAAADWAQFGQRMTEVGDRTLAEGVRLVYHHHMGTVVESESEIDALMAATGPSVHLLLDTGHATFARRRSGRARAPPSRAHQPCAHQGRARRRDGGGASAQRLSFLDAVIAGVFTVPGDGCVDYPAVFRELPGYSGWVVVEAEQDPAKAHPLTYAKLGYRNLRKYLADAGLL